MPIYTIQTPEGRKLKIEASSEADAIKGAQEWSATQSGGGLRDDFMGNVTGFMANVNRGLGIGDELAGGLQAIRSIGDVVSGKTTIPQALKTGMARQRGLEDQFAARAPKSAALGKGFGNAITVAAPGPAALQAIGRAPAATAVARGAVSAALPAYASGLADRGDMRERVQTANLSALVAAPLGGLAGGLTARGPRAPSPTPQAQEAAVREALAAQGIDPEQIALRNLAAQNADPQAIALAASARELPVPVPMTTGQLSGSPEQQLAENLALRGADGPVPATLMRGQQAMQQEALRGNTEAIAGQMTGGAPLPRGGAGEMASEALNRQYASRKGVVDAAYRAARETGDGTYLPREQVPQLAARLRESLRDVDMANPRVQSVGRALSRFDDVNSQTQVRDLFDVRSQLSLLRGDNDAMQSMAAGKAVRELDSFIDDAMTNDLFSGDPSAVAVWRNAIGQRREFAQLFEGDDLINNLTKRVGRSGERALAVDPRDASNYIFGRSDMGFVGKKDLTRDIGRLRDVLGPQSPEWNAVRAEAFQRIASQGEGAYDGGARMFSGVKFDKAWRGLQERDPALVRALFSPEEISRVNQFSMVASRATNPVRGGDNSSNTAVAAKKLLMGMKWLKAVPFLKEAADLAEGEAATAAARRAISGALPPSAPLRLQGRSLTVGETGAIGVGAGSTQQSR